jgi:hypothetical protein
MVTPHDPAATRAGPARREENIVTTTYEATSADIIDRYEKAEIAFKAAVEAVKNALVSENGYVDDDGDPDYEAMKPRVVEVVSAAVVRDPDDRAKVGVSKGDLLDLVLPDHPDRDKANKIEQVAMAQLTRYLDGTTQVSPNGYVQSRLTDGLVLVKAKVHRGGDPVTVAFVTDDPDMILTGSLQPELDKLVAESLRLSATATMIVSRQPQLSTPTRRAITAGVKKASTAAQPNVPERNGEEA